MRSWYKAQHYSSPARPEHSLVWGDSEPSNRWKLPPIACVQVGQRWCTSQSVASVLGAVSLHPLTRTRTWTFVNSIIGSSGVILCHTMPSSQAGRMVLMLFVLTIVSRVVYFRRISALITLLSCPWPWKCGTFGENRTLRATNTGLIALESVRDKTLSFELSDAGGRELFVLGALTELPYCTV